jgi:hypothetical protein
LKGTALEGLKPWSLFISTYGWQDNTLYYKAFVKPSSLHYRPVGKSPADLCPPSETFSTTALHPGPRCMQMVWDTVEKYLSQMLKNMVEFFGRSCAFGSILL